MSAAEKKPARSGSQPPVKDTEQSRTSLARRIARVLGWSVTVLVCVAALLSLVPDLLGFLSDSLMLSRRAPFSQLVALRGPVTLGLGIMALIAAVAAIVRRLRHEGGARTTILALVLVVVVAAHVYVLHGRGLGGEEIEVAAAPGTSSADPADLSSVTVLTFNTQKQEAGQIPLAVAIRDAEADIVVLPEADASYGVSLAAILTQDGLQYTVFSSVDTQTTGRLVTAETAKTDTEEAAQLGKDTVATTILVSSRLGGYEMAQRPAGLGAGNLLLLPAGEAADTRPPILGVHTIAPTSGDLQAWDSSVQAVVGQCAEGVRPTGLIVAGDFNATLDHDAMRDLGGCSDAGVEAGIGGLATWPTSSRTQLLGATIDHVLVDSAVWEPAGGQVIDLRGSDHRAVLVLLHPVAVS